MTELPEPGVILGDLLPQVFGDDMAVLTWVAVVEVMDLEDGERSIYTMTPPHQPVWNTDGLLAHAGSDDEEE